MRHSKSRYQLNRFTSWRDATLLALAKNALTRQRIITTRSRALAARPLIEKLISLGKKNSLFAKRRAYQILGEHRLVTLLFNDIAQRFNSRAGGYTRILGFGRRRGDNAELVILELTEIKKKEPKKRKEKKKEEPAASGKEEKPQEEKKIKTETAVAQKEKPPISKKPEKRFFKGIKSIFKKERDSL